MLSSGIRIVGLLIITLCPILAVEKTFELRGKLLGEDGETIKDTVPVVFLEGAATPFTSRTLVGPSGDFKFKKLLPELYRLIIFVPGYGQMERTVDVSPSFADTKGRLSIEIRFEGKHRTDELLTVAPTQLSIPNKAESEYSKAIKRLGNRDVSKAVEHLEKAIEIAPHFSVALNQLGTIAYTAADYSEAERYFREALKHDPTAYAPTVNLGAALLALKQVDAAMEFNQRAVVLRPDDPLAHSQLGQNFFLKRDFEKAVLHLNLAKSLDPGHFSYPQLVLAEVYRLQGNYQAVVEELEHFLKLHPDVQSEPKIRKVIELAQAKLTAKVDP